MKRRMGNQICWIMAQHSVDRRNTVAARAPPREPAYGVSERSVRCAASGLPRKPRAPPLPLRQLCDQESDSKPDCEPKRQGGTGIRLDHRPGAANSFLGAVGELLIAFLGPVYRVFDEVCAAFVTSLALSLACSTAVFDQLTPSRIASCP